MSLILASASPRRRELLALTRLPFTVIPADVDETFETPLSPVETVTVLATRKAEAIARVRPEDLVIGADTIVVFDGQIYGKPKNPNEATAMLTALSDKTHQVYTGVCLHHGTKKHCFHVRTDVTFYPLTSQEILDYIATGEPMDKAGAYGIQGQGGLLVSRINGDYNNVVGLPVARLVREMKAFGQIG